MRIKGIFDFKLHSNNGYGVGGATLIGFGAGGQFRLISRLNLNSEARLYFGTFQTGYNRSMAFGLKVFSGIEYTF